MRTIRVTYSKTDRCIFVSHLELLRTFNRALMCSGIPVCCSEGFNPHYLITFALPLPTGCSSVCEYADIKIQDGYEGDAVLSLNKNLPDGIKITGCGDPDTKMQDITAARYEVSFETGSEKDAQAFADKAVSDLMSDSMFIEKLGKSNGRKVVKQIYLTGLVKDLSVSVSGCNAVFELTLPANGPQNINPVKLAMKLIKMSGVTVTDLHIKRTQII
jgi:radical SAM-linked protein